MGNNTAGDGWQLARARYEYSEPGGRALGDLASRVELLAGLADRLDYPEREDARGEVAESYAHAGLVDECLAALEGVTSNADEDEVNFTGYAHIAPSHWSWAALGLARAGQAEAARTVTEGCMAWVESRWDTAQRRAAERLDDVRIMLGIDVDPQRTDAPELLAAGGLFDRAVALSQDTASPAVRARQLAAVARACARAGQGQRATHLASQAQTLTRAHAPDSPKPDAEAAAWSTASALARLGLVNETSDWLSECRARRLLDWDSYRKVTVVVDAAASGNPAAVALAEILSANQIRSHSLRLACTFAGCGNSEAALDMAMRGWRAALQLRRYGDENVDVCCALAVAGEIEAAHKAWKDTTSLRNTGMFSIRNHTYFQGHLAAAHILAGDLPAALAIADEEQHSSLWSVDPVTYIARALILGRFRLDAP